MDDPIHRLYAILGVYGCILCLYKQVSGHCKMTPNAIPNKKYGQNNKRNIVESIRSKY